MESCTVLRVQAVESKLAVLFILRVPVRSMALKARTLRLMALGIGTQSLVPVLLLTLAPFHQLCAVAVAGLRTACKLQPPAWNRA